MVVKPSPKDVECAYEVDVISDSSKVWPWGYWCIKFLLLTHLNPFFCFSFGLLLSLSTFMNVDKHSPKTYKRYILISKSISHSFVMVGNCLRPILVSYEWYLVSIFALSRKLLFLKLLIEIIWRGRSPWPYVETTFLIIYYKTFLVQV